MEVCAQAFCPKEILQLAAQSQKEAARMAQELAVLAG
jgi:hypothetical protein